MSTFECGVDCQLKTLCRTTYEPDGLDKQGQESVTLSHLPTLNQESLYTSLLPWQVRLVRILPGDSSHSLQCELLIADLVCFPGAGLVSTGTIVEYDAISYSWLDSSQQVSIRCNAISVPCSKSLCEALVSLRHSDEPRMVWADSLCINQDDSVEKSAQVRIMFTIYQKAKEVIAWLGMPRPGEMPILNILAVIAGFDSDERTLDDVHDTACVLLLPTVSEGLKNLLSRPWFSRTWIRQEAFANKNVFLRYGDSSVTIEQFYSGIDALQRVRDETVQIDTFKEEPNLVCVYLMRLSRGQPGSSPQKNAPPLPISNGLWLSGILSGCKFGVTDERDRVYGNIGMLEAKVKEWLQAYCNNWQFEGPHIPPVDYSKTKMVVYQDVVRFLINRHECLSPLAVFQRRTCPGPSSSSWTLNLDEDITRWYLATHLPLTDLSRFPLRSAKQGLTALRDLANGSSQIVQWESYQGRFKPLKSSLDGSPVLHLPGFIIGNVSSQILDDEAFHQLEFGPSLQRSPVSADLEFTLKTAKRDKKLQVRALNVTTANVKTLIDECDQKVVSLVLQHDWVQIGETSRISLCTRLLVSAEAREGDFIMLLHGSLLPMVLRSLKGCSQSQYTFLGPAMWLTFPSPVVAVDPARKKLVERSQGLLSRAKTQYAMYCDQLAALDVPQREFALV